MYQIRVKPSISEMRSMYFQSLKNQLFKSTSKHQINQGLAGNGIAHPVYFLMARSKPPANF